MSESGPIDHSEISGSAPPAAKLVDTGVPAFFVLLTLAAYLCNPIFSSKIFSHLAVGRWILAQKAVPQSNLWTVVGNGQRWLSSTWCFDLLLAQIYALGAERGLVFLKLACVFFFVFSVYHLIFKVCADRFVAVLVACLVASGSLATDAFSPALFGLGLFCILLAALQRRSELKIVSVKGAGLFLLCVLFANSHPLSILGIFVFPIFGWSSRDSNLRNCVTLSLMLLAAQVVSPYFGAQSIFSLESFFSEFIDFVESRGHVATIYHYSVSFLLLLWVLVAVMWHRCPSALRPSETMLAGLFTIIGFAVKDYIALALIFCGLLVALIWARRSNFELGEIEEGIVRFKGLFMWFAPRDKLLGGIWVLICYLIVQGVGLYSYPVANVLFPIRELNFIEAAKLEDPIFHSISDGSYIVHYFTDDEGQPKRLAFADGRAYALDRKAAGSTEQAFILAGKWKEFFETVAPNTVISRVQMPLYSYLLESAGWELVFEGGRAVSLNIDQGDDSGELSAPMKWAVFRRVEERKEL